MAAIISNINFDLIWSKLLESWNQPNEWVDHFFLPKELQSSHLRRKWKGISEKPADIHHTAEAALIHSFIIEEIRYRLFVTSISSATLNERISDSPCWPRLIIPISHNRPSVIVARNRPNTGALLRHNDLGWLTMAAYFRLIFWTFSFFYPTARFLISSAGKNGPIRATSVGGICFLLLGLTPLPLASFVFCM